MFGEITVMLHRWVHVVFRRGYAGIVYDAATFMIYIDSIQGTGFGYDIGILERIIQHLSNFFHLI